MAEELQPKVQTVDGSLDDEILESILEEISGYSVTLEEDPTLPHLGTRYLQSALARCRLYLNRVQYYMQIVRRWEKNLRTSMKHMEMDLEFKLKEKLADDPVVRQQPSIEDRKAVAASMLTDEYRKVSEIRTKLINVEESVKLIKMTYDHLNRTNADIKLQRHIVKDDKWDQMSGGDGYERPAVGMDRAVPGGLAPTATSVPIDPRDLLDPNRRPEDMPEPVDRDHARQIADFFAGRNSSPDPSSGVHSPNPEHESEPVLSAVTYDDLI